ncbi:MAG: SPASM domain-containing protein, partial [Candidatus Omnitrophica bacterium]|nr:SPASM domain-containing protein [Candidatus Omnitrophota bacterium]
MLRLLNSSKHKYPIIKIYNVVFNMNYRDIEAMIEFALQTNSEAVEFTVIDTIPGKTDKLLLSDKEAHILLENCRKIKERHDKDFKNKLQLLGFEQFMRRVSNIDAASAEYDSNIIGKIPCYAGWAFVRILADGNVNACLKSHRFPVGNILGQDFRKIWNGSPQRYFREKTIEFKQDDPFFSMIGNDPDSKMGCYKSCDNIGHNMNMHGRLASLNKFERNALKGIANIMKTIRIIKEGTNGRNKFTKVC